MSHDPASADWEGQTVADALLQRRLLTQEGILRIRQAAESSHIAFCTAATRLGLVSEKDLVHLFSALLKVETIPRSAFPASPLKNDEINLRFLKAHHALPFADRDEQIHVAMANPMDARTIACIAYAFGKSVRCYAASESDLDDYYLSLDDRFVDTTSEEPPQSGSEAIDLELLADHASDAPVIRLVHRLITGAMDADASDIHIEPSSSELTIRYRIDGMLQIVDTLPVRWAESVASRIKLLARLDIAEKRIPQDGRIRFAARGQSLDLRVATFPTLQGETVVLRLLGQQARSLTLESLDIGEPALADLHAALSRPHGIILITGPTGSGKTTTLYAALNAILRPELKVVTVEDPVEYTLNGVSQLQIKPDIGLSYATALRSVLRNDPDVIMIGEIRDRETAEIAVRAALTGHLVLATLHTNTAAGAVTRLADLGIERYLLSSTLVLTAAQRLVRRVCPACSVMREIQEDEAQLIRSILGEWHAARRIPTTVGCPKCGHRGYSGRLPLFEALPIHGEERTLIREARDESTLISCSSRKDSWSLWHHGLSRVLNGETTLAEVLRVLEEHTH